MAFQHFKEMDRIVEEKHLNDTFPYLDTITVAGRSQEEHDRNVRKFLNAVSLRNMTLNQSKTVSSTSCINILGYCSI